MTEQKTKKELNRKLAEWAGFKDIELQQWSKACPELKDCYAGYRPDGVFCPKIDFTQSLDACFRWLVPKLTNLYSPFGVRCILESTNSRFWVNITNDNVHYLKPEIPQINIGVDAESPALALSRAIWEVVKK